MSKTFQDAIELLEADHRAVKALFDEFRRLSVHKASVRKRRAVAEQICLQLTIHARLEDEMFYPRVREAVRDDDLLDQAEVEHDSAKDLIAQILSMNADDELYDAKVTVLGEYVHHHVKVERAELFPKVRKSGLDLTALGERLRVRKQELQAVPGALREDALVSLSA